MSVVQTYLHKGKMHKMKKSKYFKESAVLIRKHKQGWLSGKALVDKWGTLSLTLRTHMTERDTSSSKLSYDLHHVSWRMSIHTDVNECIK